MIATEEKKYIYSFGEEQCDGNASMKNLLGGKGANLAEMAQIGILVPPGFTITTEVCSYYYENSNQYPGKLNGELDVALDKIEKQMNKRFGDPENPLLLSIRSGARISMPGMMDTVLNLGLNSETVEGLARLTGDERFAWDSYRRFVQMYGDVVLGLKPANKKEVDPFEKIIDELKKRKGVEYDNELGAEDLKELTSLFKDAIYGHSGKPFPEDPREQLWSAIGAVFESWMNERALIYREINKIPGGWGTAVNVQAMVFGNMGQTSGTGVAFTRDPATGENIFYGEYLFNAQGEDVVAGIRTPSPIAHLEKEDPKSYRQLMDIRKKLESRFQEMMDVEFTIEQGRLWMLQARVGKRTGMAAVKIAVDMVHEGLISKQEALLRIDPTQLNQLLRPIFDIEQERKATAEGRVIASGLNAGPGAASGVVVFSAADAVERSKKGENVILVRIETSPEDIRGLSVAVGILTARGGMTSHAALVARQMGKVCVAGCGELKIDYAKGEVHVNNNGHIIKEGDYISLNGTTGKVILGSLDTRPSEILEALAKGEPPKPGSLYQTYVDLMNWADKVRSLDVRANADQPEQVKNALLFGAHGIGLCRTEHMFFEGQRITHVQQMILAPDKKERRKALETLLPMQKADFLEVLRIMNGYPVIIRTLDPPLHEFLPKSDNEIDQVARLTGTTPQDIKRRIASLEEANPMLGLRGVRLGIEHPEIIEMQVRAIYEAAAELKKEGLTPMPKVMIPLVAEAGEFHIETEQVKKIASEILQKHEVKIPILVGTMIEVPRAAITADKIAQEADFFSFGTNDLTQTTYGISRDDAGSFLPLYLENHIFENDPFSSIDTEGVGVLIEWGVKKGRKVKPDLEIGICGEHGGDPASIEFCHKAEMDYVSCSPFRIPIARLAAARAKLKKLSPS